MAKAAPNNKIKPKKCWALTKNFRKCTSRRTRFIFCREHGRLPYLVPIGLAILAVVSGIASIDSAWLRRGSNYDARLPDKASTSVKEPTHVTTRQNQLAYKNDGNDPLAITPLWYQKPPAARVTDHDGVDMVEGLDFTIPLRILNKSDKVVLIDELEFTWQVLDPLSNYEDFDKVDLATKMYIDPDSGKEITLKQVLEKVQGGYVHGSAVEPLYKYKDENEMADAALNNFIPKSVANHIWSPFKLEPYEDALIHIRLELDILMKDGKHFALNIKGQKEADEFYKLIPLFFGAKNVNDLEQTGQLLIKSNAGNLYYELKAPIMFAGATLYIPEEYLNNKQKH